MSTESEAVRGLSLLEMVGAVLRYRRTVVGIAVAVALAVAGAVYVKPRTYTASASFTPQASRAQLGALGGMAAQLGVIVPTNDGNQSPAFYADLLRSRTILQPLVHAAVNFTFRSKTHSSTFVDLAIKKGADSAQRTEAALRTLREAMAVSVAAKTGIVRIETTTRFPQLSALLTERAVELLNRFNVDTRRSQAAAQRQFLDERLAAVSRELRQAEEAARVFAQENRELRNSPQLLVQEERLNRAVTQRAQVFGTLTQALEQAKLDEIRDTPLITVTEQAVVPAHPDPRGLLLKTILALLAGLFIGSSVALLRHAVAANRRERPESFAELSSEFAAAKSDLFRIVFPLRRDAVGNGKE